VKRAVRKSLLPLTLLVVALGLAACGGGGSSSSGSTGASGAPSAEAKWGKEVEKVMRGFENRAARMIELIHTSTSQAHLEPLYRGYGATLDKLGDSLEATKAPPKCVALRKQMAEDARALGQLNTKLGHENQVNNEEFSALAAVQQEKMHRYGADLTESSYHPHC
jgi:hypothetical protein